MPRFESLNRVVCGFVGDVRYVDLISGAGGVGGGVGQGWLGRRGFYYLSAASHLISDAAAVAAGGARARGEAAAAAKAASDLTPLFCCRQHPKCLRWCRGRAMMPSITSASDSAAAAASAAGDDPDFTRRSWRPHGRRRLQPAAEWQQQTTGSGICFGRSLS